MSVALYPDHKAILHFQKSLKVYEIDFLDYLTAYLASTPYQGRHFDIYVKPTLHHSAFDFIIVEPNQALYTIQTPQTLKEYQTGQATLDYFYRHRLHTLSPTLQENIQKSAQSDEMTQHALNTPLVYLYDDALIEEFSSEQAKQDVFITGKDFQENTALLKETFAKKEDHSIKLTPRESFEIKQALNPNTNLKHYIPKAMPREYHEKAVSQSQARQKFKGAKGTGKSLVLAKRAIACSNRLKGNHRILVLAGDVNKVRALKDLITAEASKSLQELGMDVTSYQELLPVEAKYHALFIDDAEYLESKDFNDLLANYFVPMTKGNDYEYVVMANADSLPTVPKIYGPFVTLKYNLHKRTKLLKDSRKVFIDILSH